MTEFNLIIDKEKCTKCGLCQKGCDSCVIGTDEKGYPVIKQENESLCMKCQHCLASCPTGAFSIFGKNSSDAILNKDFVNSDDMLNLIKTRRSCRNYKHENVSKETIQKLKDMLAYVPTGCNNHSLHFSIIDDVEVMDEYINFSNKKLQNLLKIMPVSGTLGKMKDTILKGEDLVYRGAPHMIAVSVAKNAPCKDIDPIIALSYFELYANSLGLGTLWCGFAYACTKMIPELADKLEIPNTHKLSYIMLFGNPDKKFIKGTLPKECTFSTVKKGEFKKISLLGKLIRMFK